MNGYVLCSEGSDALAAFNDERIRFAASLDDGSGFIAFDGSWDGFDDLGTVFIAQEPTQAFLWPWRAAPKRAIATGREHYALLSLAFADFLAEQEAVTGVALVTDNLLLVESDGPIAAGAGWSASVVEFRDKRLELVHS